MIEHSILSRLRQPGVPGGETARVADSFADDIALVLAAAGAASEARAELARAATRAMSRALDIASGRPRAATWREAYRCIETFVAACQDDAGTCARDNGARGRLRSFLRENGDLGGR